MSLQDKMPPGNTISALLLLNFIVTVSSSPIDSTLRSNPAGFFGSMNAAGTSVLQANSVLRTILCPSLATMLRQSSFKSK